MDWSDRVGSGAAGVKVCCQVGCSTADVATALGLSLADLYDTPKERAYRGPRISRPVAQRGGGQLKTATQRKPDTRSDDDHKHTFRRVESYVYTDAAGTITGEVIRRQCAQCGQKSFAQRRPTDDGGWEYKAPLSRPLYRLPEVVAAMAEGRTVFVVEGEKDVDNARAAGLVATCNPGGAGKWTAVHTDILRGARVVIVADRDDTGRKHAEFIRAALTEMNCTVTVVEAAEGKDLSDHLKAGHDVAALREVPAASLAPATSPEAPEKEGDGADVIQLPRRRGADSGDDSSGGNKGNGGGGGGAGGGAGRSRSRMIPIPGMKNGWMHDPRTRTVWHSPGKDAPFALIGTVPEVLGRVTYRGTDGRHTRIAYQLATDEGAPRIVSEFDIDSGAWAGLLGRPSPSGRDEGAAYARLIRDQGAAAPEVPATTSVTADGNMVMPEADAQDLGYRQLRGPEADARMAWRRVGELSAGTERTTLALGQVFVGPVVSRLLSVPPHVLNLIGAPQQGKSTTQFVQASLFGSPSDEYQIMQPWSTTPNGLPGVLIEARSLPMVREEFSTSGLNTVDGEKLLSRIVGGCVRSRSTRTGGRAPSLGRWHSSLSSSSNRSLRRKGQTEDLAARLFELEVPFWGSDGADAARRADEAEALAMGHHGWPFEWAVRADFYTAEKVREWQQLHAEITGRLSSAPGGLALTIARVYAAWVLGAYMLGDVLDLPALGKKAEEDAMTELPDAVAEAHEAHIGPGAQLWEAVSEAVLRDPASFPSAFNITMGQEIQDGRAILGYQVEGRFHVSPKALTDITEAAGIVTPQPGLKDLKARGVLIPGEGRHWTRKPSTVALRKALPVPRFYVFNRAAADEAFGGDDDPNGPTTPPNRPAPETTGPTTPAPQPAAPTLPTAPAAPVQASAPTTPAAATPSAPASLSTPTPPAAAPAPAAPVPAQSARPASSGGRTFTAGALVVDAFGGWLSGSMQCLPLPERVDSLADLLEWADSLTLGYLRENGQRDDGQVWIMPDVAARLGLPAEPPAEDSKTAREHRALEAARTAGWQIKDLRAWMTARRTAGRYLRISVAGWQDPFGCPLLDGEPGGAEVAFRIGEYAQSTGTLYHVSPQVTGVDLNETFRRKINLPPTAPKPPRPSLVRTLEEAFTWGRVPTAEERAMPNVVAVDASAMHVGAAQAVDLGIGPSHHIEGPTDFDPSAPGLWKVESLTWEEDPRLPNLLSPGVQRTAAGGRGPATRWFTTPTLKELANMGYEIRPVEAHVWTERTRYLNPWANRIRDARARVLPAALEGDPDATAVMDAIKATYTRTLGYHASEKAGRYYYPYWWLAVVATARANFFRKVKKVADTEGRFPLTIATDWVMYATDATEPDSAVPAGLVMGRGLGQFKHAGFAVMDAVAPLLVERPTSKQVGAVVAAVEGTDDDSTTNGEA
ncbi:toprim domain-containing protein [Streptomyces sp. NPDC059278]|uniref:toprim domain-containing protein n=1 Tax=Streptomyces sp. NPDC059278 TaxID=3346801 RepID=UPI003677C00F